MHSFKAADTEECADPGVGVKMIFSSLGTGRDRSEYVQKLGNDGDDSECENVSFSFSLFLS